MRLTGLIFLAAALPGMALSGVGRAIELTPNPLGPPTDTRSAAEIEAARLARFKLEPIAKLAGEKREIRRASFADIFDPPSLPAVSFEKVANGQVEMTVVSELGTRIDTATLKPEAWAYLIRDEAVSLMPAKAAPMPAEICHGSSAVIEAARAGKTLRYEAGVCGGERDLPALFFARRMARVAVDSIPRCAPFREKDREPSWVLGECLKRTNAPARPEELAGNNRNAVGEVTDFAIKTDTKVLGKVRDEGAY